MDPCWLPSAIMQTLGAMLGIFIGIYVLAVQNFLNELTFGVEQAKQKSEKYKAHLGIANKAFFIIIFLCTTTIILNALWLDSLSTNLLVMRSIPLLGYIAFYLFCVSVSAICLYSIMMTLLFKK